MKKLVILFGILAFLVCCKQSTEELAEKHRLKGTSYMEKADYEPAIAELKKAIEIYPDFARAYYNRGICYYNTNRLDFAMDDFKTALEIDPGFVRADFANADIALIYIHRKDFVNAAIYAQRALAIDPENSTALDIVRQIAEKRIEEEAERAAKNKLESEINIQFGQIDKTLYEDKDDGTWIAALLGMGSVFQAGLKYRVQVMTGTDALPGAVFTDSVAVYIDPKKQMPPRLINYGEKYYIYFTVAEISGNDVFINLEYIEL